MLFSEVFNLSKDILNENDILDVSLDFDTPLFIDPLLIFNNENKEIKSWYEDINNFILYIFQQKQDDCPFESVEHILQYFKKEIRNNWLGLSVFLNKGKAMDRKNIYDFYENIKKIKNNDISQSNHIEKINFFQDGVGVDKISDVTTRLIYHNLLTFTEKFATKYLNKSQVSIFNISGAFFDRDLGMFINKKYW